MEIQFYGENMSNTGGVLDTYLIAQALGWEWNLWTIITINGILIGIFILIVAICGILKLWADGW